MAIISDGGGSGNQITVEGTKAARVSARPLDPAALGAYSYGGFTGIIPAALAANSEIFQFRWSDATRFAVIQKVLFSAAVSTTFFAAGVPIRIDLVKATNWTVAGTGGTAVAPAATLKRRGTFGSAILASGDMRIATTAALGVGTKTLEGNSLAALVAAGPITASLSGTIVQPWTQLFQAEVGHSEHPLILAQNEGFVIRVPAVPATGTWEAAVTISWAETVSY